ncbi:MAG: hypothetical protein HUJ61_08790 [Bacilli bacterium]|nr:hypothetical protein [Bacilli bacterium]
MARRKSDDTQGLIAPRKLKLLFTIVEREKGSFYSNLLQSYEASYQTIIYGNGTAPSELQEVLGNVDTKAVIISVVPEDRVKEILTAYEDKYFKLRKSKGIAFTISMDSIIGKMAYQFLANVKGE